MLVSIFIRFTFLIVFKDFNGVRLVIVVVGVLYFLVLEDEIVDMSINEFGSFLEIFLEFEA